MHVTKNLARYVARTGIDLSDLARKTGIPYRALCRSLGIEEPQRDLRADELANVCMFLGVNPMDFAPSAAGVEGRRQD